jgi:hypothetical protein
VHTFMCVLHQIEGLHTMHFLVVVSCFCVFVFINCLLFKDKLLSCLYLNSLLTKTRKHENTKLWSKSA